MPPAFNLSQDQSLHLELPAPKGQSIKERTWTSGHYCLGVTDVTHWSGSLCIGCFPNTGARTSHLRTLSKIRSRNPQGRPPTFRERPDISSGGAAHYRPVFEAVKPPRRR